MIIRDDYWRELEWQPFKNNCLSQCLGGDSDRYTPADLEQMIRELLPETLTTTGTYAPYIVADAIAALPLLLAKCSEIGNKHIRASYC